MRLTPLDIKKQDFARVLRGFDPDEVHAFLSMVADEWEDVRAEHRRMESKLREMESKLEHYEKVEEALQEALQTAREQSQSKLEQAERHAALTVQEARAKARDILQEAQQRHHRLEVDIERLNERRDEVIARLRAFLNAELEMLARFGQEHPLEVNDDTLGSARSDRAEESDDEPLDIPPFSAGDRDAGNENTRVTDRESEPEGNEDSQRSIVGETSSEDTSRIELHRVDAAPAVEEAGSTEDLSVIRSSDDREPSLQAEPGSELAANEQDEGDGGAIDDALFDFFDIEDEEDEVSITAADHQGPSASRTDQDHDHLPADDVSLQDRESASAQHAEATHSSHEAEGKDEIERIRRMLDELE